MRVRIHNLVTDQRYEFPATDQAAADAKIASEPSYGRAAWTETIMAYWERDIDGVPGNDIFHPEQVVEHSAEYTVEVIDTSAEDMAAQRAAAVAAVQAHLDATAQAWGYDNIYTAVGYADEPADPAFQAEGQALRAWRSRVWRKCWDVAETVQSVPELIAALPAAPERPTP